MPHLSWLPLQGMISACVCRQSFSLFELWEADAKNSLETLPLTRSTTHRGKFGFIRDQSTDIIIDPHSPLTTTAWPDLWHGAVLYFRKGWALRDHTCLVGAGVGGRRWVWCDLTIVGDTSSGLSHALKPPKASHCPAQRLELPACSGGPIYSRPTQTHSGPLPSLQSNHGPAHSQKGLIHSVSCRYMPWGEEAENGLQLLLALGPDVVPSQIPPHPGLSICYISWEIHGPPPAKWS